MISIPAAILLGVFVALATVGALRGSGSNLE